MSYFKCSNNVIHGERIHSDTSNPSNTYVSHQMSESSNDYAQRITRRAVDTEQDPIATTTQADAQEGVEQSSNSVDTQSNVNPKNPLKDKSNVPASVSADSSSSKTAMGDSNSPGAAGTNSNPIGQGKNSDGNTFPDKPVTAGNNAEVNNSVNNDATDAPMDETPEKTDNQDDSTHVKNDSIHSNTTPPFNESATPPVNSTTPPVEDDPPSANTGEPSTRPSSCNEDSINPTAPPDESEETIAAISIFFILVLLGTHNLMSNNHCMCTHT